MLTHAVSPAGMNLGLPVVFIPCLLMSVGEFSRVRVGRVTGVLNTLCCIVCSCVMLLHCIASCCVISF